MRPFYWSSCSAKGTRFKIKNPGWASTAVSYLSCIQAGPAFLLLTYFALGWARIPLVMFMISGLFLLVIRLLCCTLTACEIQVVPRLGVGRDFPETGEGLWPVWHRPSIRLEQACGICFSQNGCCGGGRQHDAPLRVALYCDYFVYNTLYCDCSKYNTLYCDYCEYNTLYCEYCECSSMYSARCEWGGRRCWPKTTRSSRDGYWESFSQQTKWRPIRGTVWGGEGETKRRCWRWCWCLHGRVRLLVRFFSSPSQAVSEKHRLLGGASEPFGGQGAGCLRFPCTRRTGADWGICSRSSYYTYTCTCIYSWICHILACEHHPFFYTSILA